MTGKRRLLLVLALVLALTHPAHAQQSHPDPDPWPRVRPAVWLPLVAAPELPAACGC